MRSFRPIQAGGRAILKKPSKPKIPTSALRSSTLEEPTAITNEPEDEEPGNFSGRVHSESYSANNLSAAFDSILSSSSSSTPAKASPSFSTGSGHEDGIIPPGTNEPTQTFLSAVRSATLSTLENYRHSILDSLAKDDPNGRIYSKNVRQMKEILAYERWRKKLDNLRTGTTKNSTSANSSKTGFSHRKELDERPSISDTLVVQKLINEFWNIDQLVDATVLVSYAGYPTLIDELLKLENVKKVIAIEEKPEYCIMYNDRWKAEVENKRLFHIKNDGYWWESYSEVEEEGLLDDVAIEDWEKSHPSLFFICQLPHNKRSIQFLMQLISFIPNRNWLFQYGRVGMGFIGSGELCQRMTRDQSEKKYTRITAAANCLTSIKTPGKEVFSELTEEQFFPTNLELTGPSPTASSSTGGTGTGERRPGRPPKVKPALTAGTTTKTKKIYKSSPEANPTAFAAALDLRPKNDVNLSPDEFECLSFLQRVMFIHSAQSWVESISHAAAGAAILYNKLVQIDQQRGPDEPPVMIPKTKTPRSFSDQDWIVLAKEFNRWPFRPRSFENDLELDADDGPGT
ncbi:Mitochondrial transcription factor 1 [Puccinia graminis f. sp. tritici]|uniref:rRNA adenine N(6)-methyltransferase n=1 Tax=Puccinia graminis f. sp. tritici TaxID=56615 RepID=A0A5B0MBP0_PUCGR|nr:Mitochondrial transcription factor 1 [Puccinia graminis f. sp. tritici]